MKSRMIWEEIGIETIPLWKGMKTPVLKGWNDLEPNFQWSRVAEGIQWNIGCRSGNGISFIDCDDGQTVGVVDDKFSSLGLKPLKIETLRGCHYYLRLQGVPEGFNISKLSIGAGELRCNRSFVVAPNSIVKGFQYEIIRGSPKSFLRQPVIDWDDLLWLLPKAKRETRGKLNQLPVPLLKINTPKRVYVLLEQLSNSKIEKRYASRSEVDAAIIACLSLAGWNYHSVKTFFDENVLSQKSHYADYENDQGQDSYFSRSYGRVVMDLSSNPNRQKVASFYQDVLNDDTLKRTDRAVYLELLRDCFKWDRLEAHLSIRDLEKLTNIPFKTVSRIFNRLCEKGYLECLSKGTFKDRKRSIYLICLPEMTH